MRLLFFERSCHKTVWLGVYVGMRNRPTPRRKSMKPELPARKGFVGRIFDTFWSNIPEKLAEWLVERSMKYIGGVVGAIFAGAVWLFSETVSLFLSKDAKVTVAVAVPPTASVPNVIVYNVIQIPQPAAVQPAPANWSTGNYFTPDPAKSWVNDYRHGIGTGFDYAGGSSGHSYVPTQPKSGAARSSEKEPRWFGGDAYIPSGPTPGASRSGSGTERFVGLGYDDYGWDTYAYDDYGWSTYPYDDYGSDTFESVAVVARQGSGREASYGYADYGSAEIDKEDESGTKPLKFNYTAGDYYMGIASDFNTPSEDKKAVAYSSYTPSYSYYTPTARGFETEDL
jgi:hypothetical protein